MNPGDIFINPSSIEVYVLVKGDDPQRTATDRRYRLSVDRYGLVNIEGYPGQRQHDNRSTHPNFNDDRAAWKFACEELIESEILEWKAIGPEDHELFATDDFHKMLAPMLNGMPDERIQWDGESPYAGKGVTA